MPDSSDFTPKTAITIDGENFLINGAPTQQGQSFRGTSIEGLLMNSRMANAMWDDENELTKHLWSYPDNDLWQADRNTNELIDMLPIYYEKGLTCIDINLQGASPLGYYRSDEEGLADLRQRIHAVHPDATDEQIWAGVPDVESQPWVSGAFTGSGDLKPAFMDRTAQIIEACDSIGIAVCLGYFYFGQDERVKDEEAIKAAVDNATIWVLEKGYRNVIIEINNESDVPLYEHEILCPPRIHELIERAAKIEHNGNRLLISTSFTRRMVPTDAVIAASDYILLHGNGMHDTAQLKKRITDTRASAAYRGQPLVFNEDDHFDFENDDNNFATALENRAGWGYFDPGPGAGGAAAYGDYEVGYQNPPINWTINTRRKESFFWFLSEVTESN